MENQIKTTKLQLSADELRECHAAVRAGIGALEEIPKEKTRLQKALKMVTLFAAMADSDDKIQKQTKVATEVCTELCIVLDKEYARMIPLKSALHHIETMAEMESIELYPPSDSVLSKSTTDRHEELIGILTKAKEEV